MQVSVIIPVYNAARFVAQAVESALQQAETSEVLLVEDGSLDNSWEVCQQIAASHDKVRLFRHPLGKNRGAGASRNLGMQQSCCEYIAFLDADDYYLPGRFSVAKKKFQDYFDCEGVYEAIGMEVVNEGGLERWKTAKKPEKYLTTITKCIEPKFLAKALIEGNSGNFSLNGLTLKKRVLDKSGYMDEGLRLHQDTDYIIRVAIVSKLYPGRLNEPVAMWRVHEQNRISAPRTEWRRYQDLIMFLKSLYAWCREKNNQEMQSEVLQQILLSSRDRYLSIFPRRTPVTLARMVRLLRLLKYPDILKHLMISGNLTPKKIYRLLRS